MTSSVQMNKDLGTPGGGPSEPKKGSRKPSKPQYIHVAPGSFDLYSRPAPLQAHDVAAKGEVHDAIYDLLFEKGVNDTGSGLVTALQEAQAISKANSSKVSRGRRRGANPAEASADRVSEIQGGGTLDFVDDSRATAPDARSNATEDEADPKMLSSLAELLGDDPDPLGGLFARIPRQVRDTTDSSPRDPNALLEGMVIQDSQTGESLDLLKAALLSQSEELCREPSDIIREVEERRYPTTTPRSTGANKSTARSRGRSAAASTVSRSARSRGGLSTASGISMASSGTGGSSSRVLSSGLGNGLKGQSVRQTNFPAEAMQQITRRPLSFGELECRKEHFQQLEAEYDLLREPMAKLQFLLLQRGKALHTIEAKLQEYIKSIETEGDGYKKILKQLVQLAESQTGARKILAQQQALRDEAEALVDADRPEGLYSAIQEIHGTKDFVLGAIMASIEREAAHRTTRSLLTSEIQHLAQSGQATAKESHRENITKMKAADLELLAKTNEVEKIHDEVDELRNNLDTITEKYNSVDAQIGTTKRGLQSLKKINVDIEGELDQGYSLRKQMCNEIEAVGVRHAEVQLAFHGIEYPLQQELHKAVRERRTKLQTRLRVHVPDPARFAAIMQQVASAAAVSANKKRGDTAGGAMSPRASGGSGGSAKMGASATSSLGSVASGGGSSKMGRTSGESKTMDSFGGAAGHVFESPEQR
ncbi:unnamed protein product [Amoebophrya sp. A25]|nr:unnamed protein product [Amoebophrya sp. A25]|eukprot:GSA25T00004874001.1